MKHPFVARPAKDLLEHPCVKVLAGMWGYRRRGNVLHHEQSNAQIHVLSTAEYKVQIGNHPSMIIKLKGLHPYMPMAEAMFFNDHDVTPLLDDIRTNVTRALGILTDAQRGGGESDLETLGKVQQWIETLDDPPTREQLKAGTQLLSTSQQIVLRDSLPLRGIARHRRYASTFLQEPNMAAVAVVMFVLQSSEIAVLTAAGAETEDSLAANLVVVDELERLAQKSQERGHQHIDTVKQLIRKLNVTLKMLTWSSVFNFLMQIAIPAASIAKDALLYQQGLSLTRTVNVGLDRLDRNIADVRSEASVSKRVSELVTSVPQVVEGMKNASSNMAQELTNTAMKLPLHLAHLLPSIEPTTSSITQDMICENGVSFFVAGSTFALSRLMVHDTRAASMIATSAGAASVGVISPIVCLPVRALRWTLGVDLTPSHLRWISSLFRPPLARMAPVDIEPADDGESEPYN